MNYLGKVAEHKPENSLKRTAEILNNEDLKRLQYCLTVLIEEIELWSNDTMITVPLKKMKKLVG